MVTLNLSVLFLLMQHFRQLEEMNWNVWRIVALCFIYFLIEWIWIHLEVTVHRLIEHMSTSILVILKCY